MGAGFKLGEGFESVENDGGMAVVEKIKRYCSDEDIGVGVVVRGSLV